jgi:hypothetical protein
MLARMLVICAWCVREGKPGRLGERAPFDNPASTHGLCARHRERLLESLPAPSFPDIEMLIVVRQNDTALYEYLARRFAGLRGVKLVMERRQDDRRRQKRPVTAERRRTDRRIRRGTASALGYTVVRFRRPSLPERPPGGDA